MTEPALRYDREQYRRIRIGEDEMPRSPEQLQKYHDMIEAALRAADTSISCEITLAVLMAYRDLLCWLLNHDNERFERVIFRLEEELLRQGIEMEPVEW